MLSYMNFPLFTQLRRLNTQQDGAGTTGGDGPDVEARLRAARTLDEAAQVVTEAVIDKLSSLLSIAVEDVDPIRTISANGVDSLVALEDVHGEKGEGRCACVGDHGLVESCSAMQEGRFSKQSRGPACGRR